MDAAPRAAAATLGGGRVETPGAARGSAAGRHVTGVSHTGGWRRKHRQHPTHAPRPDGRRETPDGGREGRGDATTPPPRDLSNRGTPDPKPQADIVM